MQIKVSIYQQMCYNSSMIEKLAERVRQLREARDWTQGQLATCGGVSRAQISRIDKATEIKRRLKGEGGADDGAEP